MREELLAEIEAIALTLAAHAAPSEKLGRLDAASIEALRKTRLLRCACPRELGGEEVDPVTALELIEALARIDGSAGWVMGILAGTTAIAGSYLPAQSAQRLFARGVPVMAGALAPRGSATRVDGGYRLQGRWAFGSGIHHADWVLAGAFASAPAGVVTVVVPREQVTVHDNWQVAGLRASGSCDYSLEDVFVPDEMTYSFLDFAAGKNTLGGPAQRLGVPGGVSGFHMAVALGIARHALDEVTGQAIEKARGVPPSSLATHPHFQHALGKAELELASARALAVGIQQGLWSDACAGCVSSPSKQAEARAAASYVTELAQRVTTVAFQAAGGGALFDANPLQRCFRDVHAAGQHFIVSQSSYRALGQFKLGLPDANPML